jgi:hypothetical protein
LFRRFPQKPHQTCPLAISGTPEKNSAAVSMTPTFSATAAEIHWFNDTPSSLANRSAARLIESGSFNGYVALLLILPPSKHQPVEESAFETAMFQQERTIYLR